MRFRELIAESPSICEARRDQMQRFWFKDRKMVRVPNTHLDFVRHSSEQMGGFVNTEATARYAEAVGNGWVRIAVGYNQAVIEGYDVKQIRAAVSQLLRNGDLDDRKLIIQIDSDMWMFKRWDNQEYPSFGEHHHYVLKDKQIDMFVKTGKLPTPLSDDQAEKLNFF